MEILLQMFPSIYKQLQNSIKQIIQNQYPELSIFNFSRKWDQQKYFQSNSEVIFYYKFIMLKISNLTLMISHPNSLFVVNKQLKLTSGKQVFTTKSIGKVLSEGQIKWDDYFSLPYNNPINFQIISRHQFGYNPEELQTVVQGKIIIADKNSLRQLKTITSPVNDLSGKRIGFLKVDVRSNTKPIPVASNKSQIISTVAEKFIQNKQISPVVSRSPSPPVNSPPNNTQKQQIIRVSSIVAHIDQIKGKNISLTLKCGNKSLKTQQFWSKAGQLVYIGEYVLKRQNNQSQLCIQIWNSSEISRQLVTQAVFSLNLDATIQKKAQIQNSTGKSIGEMFLDGKIISKDSKSKLIQSLLSHHINPQKSRYNNNSQAIKSSTFSKRKMSMMNSNNDIKFNKQKRFFAKEDKKSDYVSYQETNGSTFDFRQKCSNKFYKGASMGRGSKVYFIGESKINPGVGQYRLPSIWDRY